MSEGNVVQFIPRANPNRDKAQLGDPGIILTADGDLINVGCGKSQEQQANEIFTAAFQDTAPCEYVADDKDPA